MKLTQQIYLLNQNKIEPYLIWDSMTSGVQIIGTCDSRKVREVRERMMIKKVRHLLKKLEIMLHLDNKQEI